MYVAGIILPFFLPYSSSNCRYNELADCITQKKAIGGLLLLLPQKISSESKEDKEDAGQIDEKEGMQNVVAELEQLLIHSNIPVSEKKLIFAVLLIVIILTILGDSFLIYKGLHTYYQTIKMKPQLQYTGSA